MEGVALASGITLYRDAEGHIVQRPVNGATALARPLGFPRSDSLRGNVVFLGRGRHEATETDVPT